MEKLSCDVTAVHVNKVNRLKDKNTPFEELKVTALLFKILGDETRLRIIDLLIEEELCVCDIAVLLNMTQSAISHQLAKLKKANVVKARKEGLTVYYSLNDPHIKEVFLTAHNHANKCNR